MLVIDHNFLDSFGLDPANRGEVFRWLLCERPVGLSGWAVHPGLDTTELWAIQSGGLSDFDVFGTGCCWP